jgi:Putative zinc-finger
MNASVDPFRYDDAAYVLGALDVAERAAFEAHLATCADCRARVAEAQAGRDLLVGVDIRDLEEPAPVPETLLPGLLRAARRERMRRRLLTTSLGAVAAACAATLVVLLWPSGSGSGPAARAMTAVRPSPVTATAKLVSKGWGTEVDLVCRYYDSVQRSEPYKLIVIDDRGHKHQAGSWTLAGDRAITFTGGTSVELQDITRVQIALEDGTPILQLRA